MDHSIYIKLFYFVNIYMIYIINEYPEPMRNRWYPTWNPNQNLLSTYYEIWPALKPIKMAQYGWWRSLEWRTTNQTWKGILETIVLNQTKHEDHTSQARIRLGHGVFRDVRKIPIFGHIDLIRPTWWSCEVFVPKWWAIALFHQAKVRNTFQHAQESF